MGLFGGSKSKSKSTQTDNRVVADASIVGSGGSSVTVYNQGADKIAALNAGLLQAVSETNAGSLADIANLQERAGLNSAQSFNQVLDVGSRLFDKLLTSAQAQGDGARALAQSTVSAFTPTENKHADTFKYAAIAGAVVLALQFFKGK